MTSKAPQPAMKADVSSDAVVSETPPTPHAIPSSSVHPQEPSVNDAPAIDVDEEVLVPHLKRMGNATADSYGCSRLTRHPLQATSGATLMSTAEDIMRKYPWFRFRNPYGKPIKIYILIQYSFKDSEYIRPNDETEVDRLDMMHHIFRVMQGGKLFEAPVPKSVQRVLDLGCGTGLWAMEFAEEHPSAEVLGVDLSPIQPNFVPPNVKFEIDDIELDFPDSRSYDYIHCRYMSYAIKDWPRLVQQVYKHTLPNGIVEFTDYDLTYRSDDGTLDNTTLKAWGDDLPRAGRMMGREPCPGLYLEKWVREAGFTNIEHKVYKIPLGPWPADKHLKMLGAYNYLMLMQGIEAFSLRLFINVLKWSYEEVQVLLVKVRNDLKDRRIHAYTEMHVVWGQKPGPE
ncbi:S-adenosyl-L-methionine-dependent methyltransferase-1 [Coleophoma cylindrospora]|uniref:S-adenosyl-L-methionine-dependent methyltransferase-1 n=1 Tax=Coleophoma cylindrospora TaxID=1849047 RepID=A0A3D8RLM1_9HELO|nr:S-adenosyl-L-methionine-dependent methyltransferase-1 [Coleophoma cylindrospora]